MTVSSSVYLLLVLLLYSDQVCLELCLSFSKAISFLKQHLLHVSATGLVLVQDAFKLADLYFGGDQLEGIKDGFTWRMVTFPHSPGWKMSTFLKCPEKSSSTSKAILLLARHMDSTIEYDNGTWANSPCLC